MAAKMCPRCGERECRPNQRMCHECHAAYQRNHRKVVGERQRERDAEDGQTYGPASGLYFIRCASYVKIGLSSNVNARLRAIRCHNPFTVELIGFVPEPSPVKLDELEQSAHRYFAEYRLSSTCEWFKLAPKVLAFIKEHARIPDGSPLCDYANPSDVSMWNESGEFNATDVKSETTA